MKKKLALVLSLMMACSLAACSPEAANSTAKTTAAATTAAATTAAPAENKAADTTAAAAETTAAPAADAAGNSVAADAEWPKENITMYIPGKAGGATDTAGRLVADYIEKVTGGTVVVQNEPTGAGAVLCETLRTNDNPDYNIALMGSQNVNLLLGGNYEYGLQDPEQYTIVNRVITGAHSNAFVCSKNAPFKTYDEFVEYAKANPGKVRIAMSTGSLSEAYVSIITQAEGIDCKLLQAEASDQVVNVIGGMADCFVASYNMLEGYEGTGDLIPLVFIDDEREEKYPDVPSFADIGLGDKLASGGQFIVASAKMRPEVVARLNEILAAMPDDADAVERATTTNNVLDVLNQEESVAMYQKMFDMYKSVTGK